MTDNASSILGQVAHSRSMQSFSDIADTGNACSSGTDIVSYGVVPWTLEPVDR